MVFTALIFCLVTVMATEAVTNLNLTTLASQQTRQLALARGAVEETLKLMNADPNWAHDHPDQAQALDRIEDGFRFLTWAEVDGQHPNVFHLKCRVEQAGRPGVFQTANRTARRSRRVEGVAFAQVPGYLHGANAVDALFALDPDGNPWKVLPPAPALHYNDAGVLQTPGELARSVPFFCADSGGHLYAVSHPLWNAFLDPSSPLRPLLIQFLSQDLQFGTIWDLYRDMHFMAELNMNLPNLRSAMLRFDRGSQSWEALPPIPAFQLNAQGQVVPTGSYAVQGLLAQPTCHGNRLLVANWRPQYDLVYALDLQTGQWSALPPAPYRLLDSQGNLHEQSGYAPWLVALTQDELGNVYAQFGAQGAGPNEFLSGFFRWTGQSWQELPSPPRAYYESAQGARHEEAGLPNNFCYLRAARGGELFGLWWLPDGHGQFLKFAGGVWNPLRPPLGETPNALDPDGEGNLLVKYPRSDGPDQIYRIVDGEPQQLPDVPSTHYDDSGQLVTDLTPAPTCMNLAGGGNDLSGETQFVPVASY